MSFCLGSEKQSHLTVWNQQVLGLSDLNILHALGIWDQLCSPHSVLKEEGRCVDISE